MKFKIKGSGLITRYNGKYTKVYGIYYKFEFLGEKDMYSVISCDTGDILAKLDYGYIHEKIVSNKWNLYNEKPSEK